MRRQADHMEKNISEAVVEPSFPTVTERQVSKLIHPIQEKKDDQNFWIIVHSVISWQGIVVF